MRPTRPRSTRVAHGVAVAVVDELEVVDVGEGDADRGVLLVTQRRQLLVEVAAVPGGGEAVAPALLAGLGAFPPETIDFAA